MSSRRKVKDLYLELNAPIRSRERTPLPPPPKTARSYQTTTKPVKKSINAASFRKVDNTTQGIDQIIATSRKTREEQVQKFINDFNPKPLQVLQKIAQVSDMHSSILNRIIDELKQYPEEDLEDPIADLGRDAITRITSIKLKIIDLDNEIADMKNEESVLMMELEDAKKENEEARVEYDKFNTLINQSTFDIFNAEAKEKEIQEQIEKTNPTKIKEDSTKYNTLWGEGKHLRSEIKKVENQIKEERKFQLLHAERMAQKQSETKKVQEVEQIKNIEEYTEELMNN